MSALSIGERVRYTDKDGFTRRNGIISRFSCAVCSNCTQKPRKFDAECSNPTIHAKAVVEWPEGKKGRYAIDSLTPESATSNTEMFNDAFVRTPPDSHPIINSIQPRQIASATSDIPLMSDNFIGEVEITIEKPKEIIALLPVRIADQSEIKQRIPDWSEYASGMTQKLNNPV